MLKRNGHYLLSRITRYRNDRNPLFTSPKSISFFIDHNRLIILNIKGLLHSTTRKSIRVNGRLIEDITPNTNL